MAESVTLKCYIEQEGDQYVATIRGLDVSSYGATVDEAIKRVVDAVSLYFEVLAEDGELEPILRARGLLQEGHPEARVSRPGLFATLLRLPLPAPT